MSAAQKNIIFASRFFENLRQRLFSVSYPKARVLNAVVVLDALSKSVMMGVSSSSCGQRLLADRCTTVCPLPLLPLGSFPCTRRGRSSSSLWLRACRRRQLPHPSCPPPSMNNLILRQKRWENPHITVHLRCSGVAWRWWRAVPATTGVIATVVGYWLHACCSLKEELSQPSGEKGQNHFPD